MILSGNIFFLVSEWVLGGQARLRKPAISQIKFIFIDHSTTCSPEAKLAFLEFWVNISTYPVFDLASARF